MNDFIYFIKVIERVISFQLSSTEEKLKSVSGAKVTMRDCGFTDKSLGKGKYVTNT